jgi:hypothetical protein
MIEVMLCKVADEPAAVVPPGFRDVPLLDKIRWQDLFKVEADTRRAAYKAAYTQRHGASPPAEKSAIVPETPITETSLMFFVDADDFPIEGYMQQ